MESINKNKIFYLEHLRTLATIAVVFYHFYGDNVFKYDEYFVQTKYILFGWCVPVFLMITGTLFLNSELCEYNRVWKHIKKTVLIIVFWGLFYNLVSLSVIDGISLSTLKRSVFMILTGDTSYCYQFWYLYALIPLYLMLPVFHSFLNNYDVNNHKKNHLILLALFFMFAIFVPHISELLKIDIMQTESLSYFSMFSNLFFYMLLGAYLAKNDISRNMRIVIYSTSLAVLVFALLCAFNVFDIDSTCFNGCKTMNTALVSVAVFLLSKNRSKYSKFEIKIINIVSRYSLGIYILHVMFIFILWKFVSFSTSFAPLYISSIVNVAFVVAISVVVSYFGKKIPLIKNVL